MGYVGKGLALATLMGLGAGCEPPGQGVHMLDGDPTNQSVASSNGLAAINGLTASNGLVASNGLMTSNGLATSNGLMTSNGLATSNGLMTSNGGRRTVEYLAKCALAAGDSFKKRDHTGAEFTYYGGLGLGTGWKSGACDQECQELVSACMLAHVNSQGVSVPIWVVGNQPQIGFGQAWEAGRDQNLAEGVFMGNVFASNPPQAFYAAAHGFNNSIPGRLGVASDKPYKPLEGWDNYGRWQVGKAYYLCETPGLGTEWVDGFAINPYSHGGSCGGAQPGGTPSNPNWNWNGRFQRTLTTYVTTNYAGTAVQDNVARTVNFDGTAPGQVTSDQGTFYAAGNGFEFRNAVNMFAEGQLYVHDFAGSRALYTPGWNEGLMITRNGGAPFSLTSFDFYGTGKLVITGYMKGGSRVRMSVNGINGYQTVNVNWNNLTRVDINAQESPTYDNFRFKS